MDHVCFCVIEKSRPYKWREDDARVQLAVLSVVGITNPSNPVTATLRCKARKLRLQIIVNNKCIN
jgi:hypothetical protein